MSFSNLKEEDKKIIFQVDNIDISILNSVRRVILSEIENVAFEFEPYNIDNQKIKIIKNTCPLHNEIIQQRLSMLPINFNVNEIIDFNEDDYVFKINKKNDTTSIIDVNTGDIEIFNSNNVKYSKDKRERIFPKNVIINKPLTKDYILITKLKPNLINNKEGDEIEIEMKASKNIAKNYSGFGFVSTCVYYNMVDDTLAQNALKKNIKSFKESNSHLNKDELEKEINEITINFNNLDRSKYFHKNEYDEANKFQYIIESECLVSPKYLFFKALDIINSKIETLLVNIVNKKYKFNIVKNSNNLYELNIINEKHTLGNLIQSLFYNKFIRDDEKKNINYIGYYCPHPLENSCIIKVKLTDNDSDINIIFRKGLLEIQNIIKDIIDDWIQFSKINKNDYKDMNKFI